MKKLLEAHIHDEPDVVRSPKSSLPKSSLPKLSYKQAMQSWFILSHQVHQVSSCSSFDFQDFLDTCSASVKKPLCGALKGLRYRELIDRWYALNELLIHGATIPLFATREEARAILMAKSEDVRT